MNAPTRAPATHPWWWAWRSIWPLLPALVAVLAYLPSLAGDYVYDDGMVISDNKFVKAATVGWILDTDYYYGKVPEALEGSKEQSYRPLATLSHVLECRMFWDTDTGRSVPGGFRLTSLYLHALNALLICALARRLLGTSVHAAVFAGVLFAVHPVATEAVVVASFREDPMCLFFLLTGLLCFVWRGRAPGAAGVAWSLGGAVCFLAAMLSKEVGLIAVPLVLVADWLFGGVAWRDRRWGREAVRFGGVLAVTLFYGWVRFKWAYLAAEGTTPYPGGEHGTLASSTFTMLPVFAHYARLFVLPDVLRADYMIPVRWSFWHPEVLASFALLVGLTALGLAAALRSRAAGFGLFFMALALGPVSNLIPIRNICAERYLYVPLAGLVLAAGVGAAWVWRHCDRPHRRRWVAGAAAALMLVLGVRSVVRVWEWRSNDTIWIATVRDEPNSTRGNISAAGYHRVRAIESQHEAERLDEAGEDPRAADERSRALNGRVRLCALALVRTPWRVPDPRYPDPATAPLVEVYSDAQADRRRFEAWRLLAELDWITYTRLKEREPDSGLLHLRRARRSVDVCRKLVDDVRARGEGLLPQDTSVYDLHGRIYLALPEMHWREYWALRDRAFAAHEEERPDDVIRYNRRALALGTDREYRARLSAAQRRQVEDERWRVFSDLAGALETQGQEAEAAQTYGLALAEARSLRRAGRWPLTDQTAWWAIAGAGRNRLPADQRPPERPLNRAEGVAGAVRRAMEFEPPPDRATAMSEARRLAALRQEGAAAVLAAWAMGDQAPGTPADADRRAPWSAAADLLWILDAAGTAPSAAQVEAARAQIVAQVRTGARPFTDSWQRAHELFKQRGTAASPERDQQAVWLLRRAAWLASDPFYATAVRGLPATEMELQALPRDRWRIEHGLWWWYRSALNDAAGAAEHAVRAVEAWETARAAGAAGAAADEAQTYEKLRECAEAAGRPEQAREFAEEFRTRSARQGR